MDFVDIIIEYLPIFMFLTMGVLLFIGYPVGFILGGVAITYGFIGYLFGVFKIAEFFNFVPRMWGFSAENPLRTWGPFIRPKLRCRYLGCMGFAT